MKDSFSQSAKLAAPGQDPWICCTFIPLGYDGNVKRNETTTTNILESANNNKDAVMG